MMSAYERIQLVENLKKIDWDLEEETITLMCKYAKLKYECHLKAGFTEQQAIALVKF